ncbi:hypothetical protein DMJ27_24160 [Vibrio parahaemolyticus]|nr:hypothetical protein [Vibrio parahaemolyticus]
MIRHAWHFYYALVLVIKVVCGNIVLRASHLNWALVCKRKNVAISQDLAVKAHVVSAFNFSVNQRGKNPKLASFQRLICFLAL